MKTSVLAALVASAVTTLALPTVASAGCYGCYTPPPCPTCYQRQVAPPQYRAVQETVMVAPGGVIAHRTPAQYRTVMVPQTVLVAPEGVQYERTPAQYAVRERVEMVAPALTMCRCRRAAVPAVTDFSGALTKTSAAPFGAGVKSRRLTA